MKGLKAREKFMKARPLVKSKLIRSKSGLKAREKFMKARSKYEKKEPFTPDEIKDLTFQQRNFVRGIQVSRRVSKKEAIQLFNNSKHSEELTKNLSDDIAKAYEIGISVKKIPLTASDIIGDIIVKKPRDVGGIEGFKNIGVKGGKRQKKGYEYAGVTKRATKEQKAVFILVDKKKMRYIDTREAKTISRREKDKRLKAMIDNENSL